MSVFKSIWEFVSNPEVLTAILAVLGGLKVMSRYTKTGVDDKVLKVVEWPFVAIRDRLFRK